ncbi:hypothetical protein CC80DRAFT_529188 [Byssothecium circinans]|uniref:Uncharacterized protein n=1 Tax=Byssothecium circinans TaxID=147558 RepID=A0A6A5TBF6_9PLEO|nr:hypothetical protein CC80DRAFT_529188 [Byssothecium circinans]
MEAHNAAVAHLASRVAAFHTCSTPFRIYHGSTLSTRESSREKDRIVDTSRLNHVVGFNKEAKTVLVEPKVPMDQLVDSALNEGLLPKVVMELPNITYEASVDYIDGITYSLEKGVIMLGMLSSTPLRDGVQTFDKAADPCQTYLFRYDRSVFWCGLRAFKYFCTPFNALTRFLLDPFMYSRTMVHALHRSGLSSQTIIQDLALLRQCRRRIKSDETILNLGIWGMGPRDAHEFIRLNREFEAKTKELNGMKCLYARAYYAEEEFWQVYDESRYKALREKYHAGSLPSVYGKVEVDLKGVTGAEYKSKGEGWVEFAMRRF